VTLVPKSKLAVLLHADVVDSTVLVQAHESLAHQRIQGCFSGFAQMIGIYGGNTRELRGNALVAEFERAADALSAALAFQLEQAGFIATLSDQIRPRLRIGIAIGEVVIDDRTITGAGIVMAQRLEQLAPPGGVVIQGAAQQTIPRRLPFAYENLGKQRLKGFDEPVRAFQVTLRDGQPVPPPETPAAIDSTRAPPD